MNTDLNDLDFIKRLNAHLKAGGVIAFPTDTVWGLGALPTRRGADALFEIKRRPHEKHLIIMSDSLTHIRPYMNGYPAAAFELAARAGIQTVPGFVRRYRRTLSGDIVGKHIWDGTAENGR